MRPIFKRCFEGDENEEDDEGKEESSEIVEVSSEERVNVNGSEVDEDDNGRTIEGDDDEGGAVEVVRFGIGFVPTICLSCFVGVLSFLIIVG